jgi:Ca2+-transporting ATPase
MTGDDHNTNDVSQLATAMALCNDAELGGDDGGTGDVPGDVTVTGEPTEAALVVWAAKLGMNKDQLRIDSPRVGEAPFDPLRKMMSTVHAHSDGGFMQYTKGAPDEILKKCTHILKDGRPEPLTDAAREEILTANREMANRALRVLAAARRAYDAEPESFDVSLWSRGFALSV